MNTERGCPRPQSPLAAKTNVCTSCLLRPRASAFQQNHIEREGSMATIKTIQIIAAIILVLAPFSAFSQRRDKSIRSVDFSNFTFPLPSDLIDRYHPMTKFTLRDGHDVRGYGIGLGPIKYADVTGDGGEEAIFPMSVETGGSASPGVVYIYTISGGRPKLLWYFSTGDRVDGGLQNVYGENGKLVVEVYGPEFYGPERQSGDVRFTRTSYLWRDNQFRRVSRTVISPGVFTSGPHRRVNR